MNIFKNKVEVSHEDRRAFNYAKDKINLGFTLNIDNTKELSVFKELLKMALEDVSKEIEKQEVFYDEKQFHSGGG